MLKSNAPAGAATVAAALFVCSACLAAASDSCNCFTSAKHRDVNHKSLREEMKHGRTIFKQRSLSPAPRTNLWNEDERIARGGGIVELNKEKQRTFCKTRILSFRLSNICSEN